MVFFGLQLLCCRCRPLPLSFFCSYFFWIQLDGATRAETSASSSESSLREMKFVGWKLMPRWAVGQIRFQSEASTRIRDTISRTIFEVFTENPGQVFLKISKEKKTKKSSFSLSFAVVQRRLLASAFQLISFRRRRRRRHRLHRDDVSDGVVIGVVRFLSARPLPPSTARYPTPSLIQSSSTLKESSDGGGH